MNVDRRASDTEAKLRRLEAVTDAALSSLELDDMLAQLMERTRDLLGVETAAILLRDPGTDELVATAASGLEAEVRQGLRVPIGAGFTGRVAMLAAPVVLDRVDRESVHSQILAEKGLACLAGVPMMSGNEVIGVLHVGSREPRSFHKDDLDLLRLVADRAAMATQARRSQLERATTLALQRSLLPARPPAIPGLDVAARYLPGAAVGVGGDWYDLFTLPSGNVGVVIGDVAGNGLRAAVVMGRIRSALRAYALESDDPAEVLRRLDRKIQLFEPDAMATAAYAVINPARDQISVALAGHLPPVLIEEDARPLPATVDFPLGAYAGAPRHTTTTVVDPGWGLFLYTDGLIERHDQPISDGIGDLMKVLSPVDAEQMCVDSMKLLPQGQPTGDDVALMAVRHLA